MGDFHFYIDDSGTRNPDKRPDDAAVGDWFALGGVIVKAEDEQELRDRHSAFCDQWCIDYPLHSSDIRFKTNDFCWLKELDKPDQDRFYSELGELIVSSPVLGLACVVDRPGYNARYREKYGRQRWSLCKTAFSVVAERAAKYAISQGRRLRIYPERSDPGAEQKLRSYYRGLHDEGMPFHEGGNVKYQPLGNGELRQTLREFRLKFKSSPPMQIADLYLYPMCRNGYVEYRPMEELRAAKKLVDNHLTDGEVPALGIKYSCFDMVKRAGAR